MEWIISSQTSKTWQRGTHQGIWSICQLIGHIIQRWHLLSETKGKTDTTFTPELPSHYQWTSLTGATPMVYFILFFLKISLTSVSLTLTHGIMPKEWPISVCSPGWYIVVDTKWRRCIPVTTAESVQEWLPLVDIDCSACVHEAELCPRSNRRADLQQFKTQRPAIKFDLWKITLWIPA